MAQDIKPTPVIRGKDAINFAKKLEDNKTKKVDKEILLTIYKDSQIIRSMIK
jgi:hypothetical protein